MFLKFKVFGVSTPAMVDGFSTQIYRPKLQSSWRPQNIVQLPTNYRYFHRHYSSLDIKSIFVFGAYIWIQITCLVELSLLSRVGGKSKIVLSARTATSPVPINGVVSFIGVSSPCLFVKVLSQIARSKPVWYTSFVFLRIQSVSENSRIFSIQRSSFKWEEDWND